MTHRRDPFGADHLLYGSDFCSTQAATAPVQSIYDAIQPPEDHLASAHDAWRTRAAEPHRPMISPALRAPALCVDDANSIFRT